MIKILLDENDYVIIEEKKLSDLDVNDSFFNTLKKDYDDFEIWFQKKQKQGTKAYVTMNNEKITSFLMLKEENENEDYYDFDKTMLPFKRLKISTMKVIQTGERIADAFIKIIFQEAKLLNANEIYYTAFNKQHRLINFLSEYGFEYYCKKKTKTSKGNIIEENVYIKKLD